MRITEVKKTGRLKPSSSCGTGYSEPDFFIVKLDNGRSESIYVDIWYLPLSSIRPEFVNSVRNQIGNVEDIEEAYRMYVKEVAKTSCPYSEEELLSV